MQEKTGEEMLGKGGNVVLAVSIIIAGLIIAGAVLLSNRNNTASLQPSGDQAGDQAGHNGGEGSADLSNIDPVTSDDHILGDPNAPVKIVEYSDLECPFCTRLHPTLEEVVEQYDGQVAWVYRHFPLRQIHANAQNYSEAAECVAELGGNEAFWSFIDDVFKNPPQGSQEVLNGFAEEVGVSGSDLESCQESGRHTDRVNSQYNDAIEIGGRGTPWSVVIGPGGEMLSVTGAQPLSAWTQIIDSLLES